jgi:SpoVK/Ycf46/Vps4 family AAA+-type ATPase
MLRRMPKRIYVGPPTIQTRQDMVTKLLRDQCHCLRARDLSRVAAMLEGYSGSDIKAVCQEASMGPLRGLSAQAV